MTKQTLSVKFIQLDQKFIYLWFIRLLRYFQNSLSGEQQINVSDHKSERTTDPIRTFPHHQYQSWHIFSDQSKVHKFFLYNENGCILVVNTTFILKNCVIKHGRKHSEMWWYETQLHFIETAYILGISGLREGD